MILYDFYIILYDFILLYVILYDFIGVGDGRAALFPRDVFRHTPHSGPPPPGAAPPAPKAVQAAGRVSVTDD